MKIKCPICGVEGFLQQRGNSGSRVQHYEGFIDGKRVYAYHAIGSKSEILEVTCKQNLEVNIANLEPKRDLMARDVGFEPTRPFDHRLSRPAPYQAWGIPHADYSQSKCGILY